MGIGNHLEIGIPSYTEHDNIRDTSGTKIKMLITSYDCCIIFGLSLGISQINYIWWIVFKFPVGPSVDCLQSVHVNYPRAEDPWASQSNLSRISEDKHLEFFAIQRHISRYLPARNFPPLRW